MSTIVSLLLCAALAAPASAGPRDGAYRTEVSGQKVSVEFYSPEIVRVVKYDSAAAQTEKKSYSVILKPQKPENLAVSEDGDITTLSSASIIVKLKRSTGEIDFLSADGKPLLSDIRTTFEARNDEANKGRWRIGQSFRLDGEVSRTATPPRARRA